MCDVMDGDGPGMMVGMGVEVGFNSALLHCTGRMDCTVLRERQKSLQTSTQQRLGQTEAVRVSVW